MKDFLKVSVVKTGKVLTFLKQADYAWSQEVDGIQSSLWPKIQDACFLFVCLSWQLWGYYIDLWSGRICAGKSYEHFNKDTLWSKVGYK